MVALLARQPCGSFGAERLQRLAPALPLRSISNSRCRGRSGGGTRGSRRRGQLAKQRRGVGSVQVWGVWGVRVRVSRLARLARLQSHHLLVCLQVPACLPSAPTEQTRDLVLGAPLMGTLLVRTAPTRRTTDTTTQGLPWACAHASVKLSAPTSCRSIFDAMVLEGTTWRHGDIAYKADSTLRHALLIS